MASTAIQRLAAVTAIGPRHEARPSDATHRQRRQCVPLFCVFVPRALEPIAPRVEKKSLSSHRRASVAGSPAGASAAAATLPQSTVSMPKSTDALPVGAREQARMRVLSTHVPTMCACLAWPPLSRTTFCLISLLSRTLQLAEEAHTAVSRIQLQV